MRPCTVVTAARCTPATSPWTSSSTQKTLQGRQDAAAPERRSAHGPADRANGYLGRFLALDWLERLAPDGGRLICIARGSSAAGARQRIEAAFDGDAELIHRFHDLAEQHLEVIAGDIGEANLGLDDATWYRLADSVDLIVHAAAHVNHVLPYSQLFGANVVGTAELIRLAITKRLKAFNYISTVAAAMVDKTFGHR